MWTLFATAMGAGVLYLPVNAGINGIWPFIFICLFTIPMIYLSHKNLSTVVLSASQNSNNINDIVFEHFSPKFCNFFALCYFLAIYPLILIYSVGLTNTANSFLSNIVNIDFIPRYLLSLIILSVFLLISITKNSLIRKITEVIALPLAASLFLISLYLIPKWNLEYLNIMPSSFDMLETLWLTMPVVVFSFNFSPIISTFTINYLEHHPEPKTATKKILWNTTVVLFIFIVFFVISCVLCVTPDQMLQAKQKNMNILIYMGYIFDDQILRTVSPIIAMIAMSGAFLGTFFGAKESVIGLLEQKLHKHKLHSKKLDRLAIAIIFIPSYIFCLLDTNVLDIISVICGPIIAMLLFVFPVYAIYKIPELSVFRESLKDKLSLSFILCMGLISCSAILYSFKYLRFFLK